MLSQKFDSNKDAVDLLDTNDIFRKLLQLGNFLDLFFLFGSEVIIFLTNDPMSALSKCSSGSIPMISEISKYGKLSF